MRTKDGELLRKGLEELGFVCSDRQIDIFGSYREELKKWNKAYNLTGLSSDRDIIVRHFLDSLLFAKVLPADARSVADIGSGAGFPGIPVKIIMPSIRLYLIEPTMKKAIFLRHICGMLDLEGVEVIDRRIEDLKDIKVDAAMTRALFKVGEFIEKAGGLLNEGGVLIMSKGPKIEPELHGLDDSMISVQDLILPVERIVRHMVLVRQCK